MKVGRSSPRNEKIALVYPHSRVLQGSLLEYFTTVIQLCHRIVNMTRISHFGQAKVALAEHDLKSFQSRLEKWSHSIKDEVADLLILRVGDEFTSDISTADVRYRRALAYKISALDFCSVFDHETIWKQTRKIGNTALAKNNSIYQQWKEHGESSTIVITGKLGSGKSVLLANMVDDLNLFAQSKNASITYFFCRFDAPESLKSRNILGSFARQILTLHESFCLPHVMRNIEGRLSSALRSHDLMEVLLSFHYSMQFLPHARLGAHETFLVLDGLDECDDSELTSTIDTLCLLQGRCRLKVCLSFRSGAEKVPRLQIVSWNIKQFATSIPDDNPDIKTFVEAELKSRLDSEKLVIQDPHLISDIENALVNGAQGTFLWAALQVSALCLKTADSAIRRALENLPETIVETYSRIVQRLGPQTYQKRTLEILAAARRLLTVDEVREALSVVPGNTEWDPSHMIEDMFSMLSQCCSLIVIDEEDLTLRFIHGSVKKFVWESYKDANRSQVPSRTLNKTMADIIVTYLHYNIFDTELATQFTQRRSGGGAPAEVVRATPSSPNSIYSKALNLLRTEKKLGIALGSDIRQVFAELDRQMPRSTARCRFVSYAEAHLLDHAWCYLWEPDSEMYRLFFKIWRKEISPSLRIDFEGPINALYLSQCEWDSEDEDEEFPIEWESEEGQCFVFGMLLENSYQDCIHDRNGDSVYSWASKHAHVVILTQLCERMPLA